MARTGDVFIQEVGKDWCWRGFLTDEAIRKLCIYADMLCNESVKGGE